MNTLYKCIVQEPNKDHFIVNLLSPSEEIKEDHERNLEIMKIIILAYILLHV